MKHILLLLVLIISSPTCSQSVEDEQAEAFFFSLIVEDIEKSEKWYANVLGFDLQNETMIEDRGIHIKNMTRKGMMLELIQLNNSSSLDELKELKPDLKQIQGIFKIGFSFQNFDSWLKRFESHQINTESLVVKIPGSDKRMLVLTDPDGNRVQIFED